MKIGRNSFASKVPLRLIRGGLRRVREIRAKPTQIVELLTFSRRITYDFTGTIVRNE